ncbi:MAG: response regulator [Chloroflexota bacterium]
MARTPERKPGSYAEQAQSARLEADLALLRRRLGMFAALSQRLSASLDPQQVLRSVAEGACELLGARYGAVGIFGPDGSLAEFITHGVSEAERERIGHQPIGSGLLGLLQEEQRPLRLADLRKHPRVVGFSPGHPQMHTFLGVPLRLEGVVMGHLYLTEKLGGQEFSADDEELAVLLAGQAAMAIRNARSHADAEAERERLRTLVETSPAGVFVVSAGSGIGDSPVRLVNREAARILGSGAEADGPLAEFVQGATYFRFDGTPFPDDELPLRRALFKGERVQAEELLVRRPDGTDLPVLVNATPLYDTEGRISAAVGVLQDISPIMELEQLRNEFLAMVSHELKTPLTAIKGSAAMALGSKRLLSTDESHELFGIIDDQSDRLRDLVDNLLDVSRIEAGTLSIAPEPMHLEPVVEEAVAALERMAGHREVVVELVDDLPAVQADPQRVQQVLVNLLTNAAKFSPETAPITLRAEQTGSAVQVCVADGGRGFSPQEAGLLFRKFSQLPTQPGGRRQGSGLGLAICKGIVEAHGGRIRAESEGAGKGCSFLFTLPIAAEQPARPAPAEVTQRAAHMGRISRPGERTRVLVVDDEAQVLRFVQRALDEAGYRPFSARDGSEAVRMVESEEPDLVLMDVNLPGQDGMEVLRRIREFSGVPVIFLTAVNDAEQAARALRSGADDWVTKPFVPDELLARIEAALRRRVLADRTEVRATYRNGALEIDFADRRVAVDAELVPLSATEYKLLFELASNAGRVLTHDQILHNVWGPEYSGASELVRSFIRNLRRKLGDDARNPRYILTEPQVGYRMARAGD